MVLKLTLLQIIPFESNKSQNKFTINLAFKNIFFLMSYQQVNLENIYQFGNPKCLTNFEANELFNNADNDFNNSDQNDTRKQLFEKASYYASMCQQFNNASQLTATRNEIRRILKENDFEDDDVSYQNLTEEQQDKLDKQIEYDTVMLLNLCPGTVEDARAYIPSLKRKSDNQVHEIITQLTRFRI